LKASGAQAKACGIDGTISGAVSKQAISRTSGSIVNFRAQAREFFDPRGRSRLPGTHQGDIS
jgi:hypothetical protein